MDIQELHRQFLKSSSVCTDSRKISPNCIFFALKGVHFNGNSFAAQALSDGASIAVIDEDVGEMDERFIMVEDALSSLQELAAYHRRQMDIPLIGITGSNGKTTTKELIRDVLSKKFNVLATRGNLNNHIGVPLTLLELKEEHEVAIIEMGANHLKEIDFLCGLARPNHGLITNIGKAHIGEFGGMENIIKGKTELFDSLRKIDGLVFVNGDDQLLLNQCKDLNQVTYGSGALNDMQGRISSSDPYLELEIKPDDLSISTSLVGDYNFPNVMAAVCIGDHFQIPLQDIIKAIEAYSPDNNRSQLIEREGKKIIMDAYNANPSSMESALRNFAAMEGGRKLAILGDMLELGNESKSSHQEIASLCSSLSIDTIYIGQEFNNALEGDNIRSYQNTQDAIESVKSSAQEATSILIKGSRGVKLERLLDHI